MRKVIVIGSPGAGKSTFARSLRDKTGLPLYYLDMLWHKPDGTNIPESEFDMRLNEIMRNERWIIDGNYQRTLELRLKACDTVFLLDYPAEACLAGARERIGRRREDMPWVESELDPFFEQAITEFPAKNSPKIYEMLVKYREEKDIFIFKSRDDSDNFLKGTTAK